MARMDDPKGCSSSNVGAGVRVGVVHSCQDIPVGISPRPVAASARGCALPVYHLKAARLCATIDILHMHIVECLPAAVSLPVHTSVNYR